MIKPRGWQIVALDKFKSHRSLCFLQEATPAAGKTIFAGFCAQWLLKEKEIDFCLAVAPTVAIKGDADAGFLGDWHKLGLEITSVLKDGRDWPADYCGAVITYHQLPNIIDTLEMWARNGLRIFLIFDEVHHLHDRNVWGSTSERLARCCPKILAMTGTAFRTDGRQISFVKYDETGTVIPDDSFSYRDAVASKPRVCRPVEFITDDGLADFILNEEEKRDVRLSEANRDDDAYGASRVIFDGNSDWLRQFIERADECLDQYRTWDTDAGMLVVCRPGMDENDDRHLMQVAKLVSNVIGDDPEIVFHEDKQAAAKIARFRKSNHRCICAVRMISEGVDIKRLRVLVMATRPKSELLFRQLVGRVLRVDNDKRPGDATVYIAKFPQLMEWASRFAEEAEAGLKIAKDRERELGHEDRDRAESSFISLGSKLEQGGAISDFGDEFTAEEINSAERQKISDPQLYDVPLTTLAHIRRSFGIQPDPFQPVNDPLQIQKKKIRADLAKAVRRLANHRNEGAPDYSRATVDVLRISGARTFDDLMDNYSIEIMRQTLGYAQSLMRSKPDVA